MTTNNNFKVKNGLDVGSDINLATGVILQNTSTKFLDVLANEVQMNAEGQDIYTFRLTPGNSQINTGQFQIFDEGANTEQLNITNSAATFTPPVVANAGLTIGNSSSGLTFGDATVQNTAAQSILQRSRSEISTATTSTIVLVIDSSTDSVTTSTANNIPAFYDSVASIWRYIFNNTAVTIPAPPAGPPVAGYVGWYDVSSFAGSTWNDMSGNGYDATVTGSPTVTSVSGSGGGTFDAILGTPSDTIVWPMNMGTDWTLFTVSRYNGSTKERIYELYRPSDWGWLMGHHSNKSGVVYYGGALNSPWIDHFGSNWVINTSQNNPDNGLYNANGINYPINSGTAISKDPAPLCINSKSGETSDFATVEVIIYDSILSSGDIAAVEAYLAAKYSITI